MQVTSQAVTRPDVAAPPPVTRGLLADGTVVRLRALTAQDGPLVQTFYRELPVEDRYLRFFSGGSLPRPDIGRAGSGWVGAFRADALVGVAEYATTDEAGTAEVALAVAHPEQTHGVGTLLLEHLAALGRRHGVRRFGARVLAENSRMRRVLADLGLTVHTRLQGDELIVELDLNPDAQYLEAVAAREQQADVASLRPALRPRSIVVVGASRRPDTVGNAVLRSIVRGGFTGPVHAVNPHAAIVAGVGCFRSVADLPGPPDLAVLCVPAAAVPDVAEACGRRGVRALLVISSGLSADPGLAARLVEIVRRHDLRMIGPNCLGIANGDPGVRLDASFAAPGTVVRGDVGLVSQSGGVTIAVQDELRRLGLGVSTAVSTGDKYDVSANDLLLWWHADPHTAAAVLYLESFGNPRKFSRFARRLAARVPAVTLRSGSSEAGQRAAVSHTAATATPRVVRDALFRQAGVSAVDRLSEVGELLALLRWQPLPTGRQVAVVSNAGGTGVLAADACIAAGLTVPALGEETRRTLARLLPNGAAVANPVDTTAVVAPKVFADAVRILLADPQVDAVLAVTVPVALADPGEAIAFLAADSGAAKPLLAVRPTQIEHVRAVTSPGSGGRVPSFADAAAAAVALAHAADRAAWLAKPRDDGGRRGPKPDLARACGVVARHLEAHPEGGWLRPDEIADVLMAFGLPLVPATVAPDAEAAVAAFVAAERPVAVKAVADGVLHKSAAGGVKLDLDSAEAVTAAVAELTARFGRRLRGLLVQPMAEPGPELLVGVTGDPAFGPLVTVGVGGTFTDLVADRAHRLVPLSTADADELLDGFHAAAALLGAERESRRRSAFRDLVLQVGRLAELIPEIGELDLNPVISGSKGCVVVDARIRIVQQTAQDSDLRDLQP